MTEFVISFICHLAIYWIGFYFGWKLRDTIQKESDEE